MDKTGFEIADALDRFRAVRRGTPYKTLWPSDIDEAIEALEEKLNRRTAPENKPLTLDELRQMDGEPVKVVEDGKYQYGLVSLSGHFLAPKEEVVTLCGGNFFLLREMKGNFEVYPARKPEQEATL